MIERSTRSHLTIPRVLLYLSLVVTTTGNGIACSGDSPVEPHPSEQYPGGETTNDFLLGIHSYSRNAENTTDEHELAFFAGNSFFNQPWVQAPASTKHRDGLGPLFNARSCAACHFKDGRGRPPRSSDEPFVSMLIRLSTGEPGPHGGPTPVPGYGGQLQPFSIDGVPAEATPRVTYQTIEGTYDDGTPYQLLKPTYQFDDPAYGPFDADMRFSPRVAPHLVGMGLLEAIPADRLEALADPKDNNHDGISGTLNRVWRINTQSYAPGRFGWKAEEPTVRQQVAGAFLGDMGLTTPLIQQQNCLPEQLECQQAIDGGTPEINRSIFEDIVTYTKLLAVPVRRNFKEKEVLRGRKVFYRLQCHSCHTPGHKTGVDPKLPEVSHQQIYPYTDLLLHDMGPGLADGRPIYKASGSEWRTPPLWGLGLMEDVNGHTRLLHDGRARGFAEAILWHGGEAEAAKQGFLATSKVDRKALIQFLESL